MTLENRKKYRKIREFGALGSGWRGVIVTPGFPGIATFMSLKRLALAYAFTLAVSFLIGLTYALTIPLAYTTDALLIGKEQSSGSMSTLASATKLLGMGGGGDQSSNFAKFQKYWGSRDVAEQILRKNPGLLRQMFGRDWDK